LEEGLKNARGARLKALEAVTQEYTTLFKVPLADLFQFSQDRYNEVLPTEIHAQADVTRQLGFEIDWVWEGSR
jgi:hypothetical protein